MLIKKIRKENLEDVLSLALKTPELHTQQGEPDYYTTNQLMGFVKNPDAIFLGAFLESNFIGFVLSTYDRFAKETYIINLVVEKDLQHHGIGQMLINYTFNELKNRDCEWVWVLVHEYNDRMQSFLSKQSFEKGPKFVYFR